MKLRGLTAQQVDEHVDVFAGLMRIGMRKSCEAASSSITALTADGATDGDLSFAVDSLGVMSTQWETYADQVLMPALADITLKAGKAVVSPLGSVNVPDVKTGTFLEQLHGWVTEFAGEMWQAAKTALISGAQDGESIAQLATRVAQVAEVKEKKAHVIAQTAVIASINGGEWQQMMEFAKGFDVKGVKEWEATEDSHTRPSHHSADGQRVPIDAHFVVGGVFLMFPGDPTGSPGEVVNCRCTTLYDLDMEDQITASQTSPGHGTAAASVDTNGQNLVTGVTAAFNVNEHPRGKDGKFIKAGVGLPEHVLQGLKFNKKSIDWGLYTDDEKSHFIFEIPHITSDQWANLKDGDKEHIKQIVSDALDDGQPGSAKASMHLEDLDLAEVGGDENLFNPDVALPTPMSTPSAAAAKGVEKKIYEAYDAGTIDKHQQQTALDTLDTLGEGEATKYLNSLTTPTVAPTLTTGSSTPIKITHGLIHAKHTPGTIIAESDDGLEVEWNGTSYDIINETGEVEHSGVKKSKLYALLNSEYANAKWHSKGKQETEVSHATPLDAAPSPTPIPHPVSSAPEGDVPGLSNSATSDQLDDVFGGSDDVKSQITSAFFANEITAEQFNELVDGINDGSMSAVDAKTKLNTYVNGVTSPSNGGGFADVDDNFGGIKVEAESALALWDLSAGSPIAQAIDDKGVQHTLSKVSSSDTYVTVTSSSTPGVFEKMTQDEFKSFAESKGLHTWSLYTGGVDLNPTPTPSSSEPFPSAPSEAFGDISGLNGTQLKELDTLWNQYHKGLMTTDELYQQVDLVKNPVSTPTPSVTVTADDVPTPTKWAFYGHFKNEKVSPAWSGAKIYASLHAAKQKMSGDPKIAGLSDNETLKVLDEIEKAKTGKSKAYSTKVREWLKTPNGKKAFKELNPSIPTTTPSIAKKIAKKSTASTAIDIGSTDASVFTESEKTNLYGIFKAMSYGKYLSDPPEQIYWNAKQHTKPDVSVGQILALVDEQGAKKFGVPDAKSFQKKINDWLAKPSGKKKAAEIEAGTWSPLNSSHSSSFSSGLHTDGPSTHTASAPLVDKVHSVDQHVPAWNPSDTTDYPTISTHGAADLWNQMQATHGNMTAGQRASLRHYTTNTGYTNMNMYLRGQKGATDATKKHVTNAQNGMRPTTKAITVHRGSGWFKSTSTGQQWTSYENIKKLQGGTFHNESFFSASVGGHAAFGGSIKFEVECPVGTPMAYVKAFSHYGGENEMLLAADLNFKIMDVVKINGTVHVKLRVMAAE
jgi:hypothetical protein